MADFYQHPMIATLQKLKDRPVDQIEDELRLISLKRKMVLLLPALVTEFDTPAMPKIIDELIEVDYLDKIVLSLDRANWDQFEEVKKKMSVLQSVVKVVWHDGPRMQTLYDELKKNDYSGNSRSDQRRASGFGGSKGRVDARTFS